MGKVIFCFIFGLVLSFFSIRWFMQEGGPAFFNGAVNGILGLLGVGAGINEYLKLQKKDES